MVILLIASIIVVAHDVMMRYKFRSCRCGWITKDAYGRCNGCGVMR